MLTIFVLLLAVSFLRLQSWFCYVYCLPFMDFINLSRSSLLVLFDQDLRRRLACGDFTILMLRLKTWRDLNIPFDVLRITVLNKYLWFVQDCVC